MQGADKYVLKLGDTENAALLHLKSSNQDNKYINALKIVHWRVRKMEI